MKDKISNMTKQYVFNTILNDKIKSSTLVCQEPMMGSCVCPLKKVVHFNARDEWRDQVFEIQTELRKNLSVPKDKNRKIAFPALQTSCQQMSYCRKKNYGEQATACFERNDNNYHSIFASCSFSRLFGIASRRLVSIFT